MKILIYCIGNSCRSQMAHGYLKSMDMSLELYSAGTNAAASLHPNTITVMSENGIDISDQIPNSITEYTDMEFDYLISVCSTARAMCPEFKSNTKKIFHFNFDDPHDSAGSKEEILSEYRRVRDQIKEVFLSFYHNDLARPILKHNI